MTTPGSCGIRESLQSAALLADHKLKAGRDYAMVLHIRRDLTLLRCDPHI
jgi:hypothetical protein